MRGVFLSTLPARGATLADIAQRARHFVISIHAPREGSDSHRRPGAAAPPYFYPRSPRGERQDKPRPCYLLTKFLSTLPARGATAVANFFRAEIRISIHAPREGSDRRSR